jgi:8-oxo-dGTP pyrophosphatase MutT (NUDIX family)
MNLAKIKSRPLHLMAFRKRELRTQFGAICWRMRKGSPEFLLITSRGTGRWIIPKGWPQKGQTAASAAATEAWEEAGVRGDVASACLGIYGYEKRHRRRPAPCVVAVFGLEVKEEADKWPERKQRKRRWVSPGKAAALVAEPELSRLLKEFGESLNPTDQTADN